MNNLIDLEFSQHTLHSALDYDEKRIQEVMSKSELIKDNLPSGSGLNYNWSSVSYDVENACFVAETSYQVMNDVGMYCGSFDLRATIPLDLSSVDVEITDYSNVDEEYMYNEEDDTFYPFDEDEKSSYEDMLWQTLHFCLIDREDGE